MFDAFQKRVDADRASLFGPQPQAGQQIIDRAIELGAISPATAQPRASLDVRHDENWAELVACGYLRESSAGRFYAAHPDGSADVAIGRWTPLRVLVAIIIAVGAMVVVVRRMRG